MLLALLFLLVLEQVGGGVVDVQLHFFVSSVHVLGICTRACTHALPMLYPCPLVGLLCGVVYGTSYPTGRLFCPGYFSPLSQTVRRLKRWTLVVTITIVVFFWCCVALALC